MKPNLPLTLLGAALLAVPAAFGQASSGVMGFSNVTCNAGTNLVVPTLVNSSVFQGQAAISSDGLTITPTTAPGWTVGAYNATSFASPTPNYPKYYAEIVSGGSEGLVLDISSNSATALTMASAVTPAGLRGTTVQIAIREHVTLDKIIQGASGLSDLLDAASVFDAAGAQSIRYYVSGSWVKDDYTTPAGHTVIYPGTGFVFSPAGTVTLTLTGEVKPTKTQVPLYTTTTNIVGPMNPASAEKFYNNTLAAAMAPLLDGLNNFSTDGNMSIQGTYYSDGTQILNSSYAPLTAGSTDAIPLNRGIVVSVTGDTVWTVNSALAP